MNSDKKIFTYDTNLPILATVVGYNSIQPPVNRYNKGYKYHQILQTASGAGEIVIDGKTIILKENQCIFIPKKVINKYHALTEIWKTDFISFDGTAVETILENLGFNEVKVFNNPAPQFLQKKLQNTISVMLSNNPYKNVEASNIAYSILCDFAVLTKKNKTSKLFPVLNYINENFNEDLSLEQLAKLINVTPNHLCHLFKQELSIRPFEYILKCRIDNSKMLLLNEPQLTIEKIANLSGFEHFSYFGRVFKRFEGVSPSDFRKINLY